MPSCQFLQGCLLPAFLGLQGFEKIDGFFTSHDWEGCVTALSVAAVRRWQRVGLPYPWFLGVFLDFSPLC
jgi:hypothetical protein